MTVTRQALNLNRFEIMIENVGEGDIVRWRVTTNPDHDGIRGEIAERFPHLVRQKEGGQAKVIVTADFDPTTQHVEVSHRFENATMARGDIQHLYGLAREGVDRLANLGAALEYSRKEMPVIAKQVAAAYLVDPERLDRISVTLMQVNQCRNCDGYHIFPVDGESLGELIGSMMRFEVKFAEIAAAGKVPMLDPDSIIMTSDFRDVVVAELEIEMAAAIHTTVAALLTTAEAELVKFVGEATKNIGTINRRLTALGISVPEQPYVEALANVISPPPEVRAHATTTHENGSAPGAMPPSPQPTHAPAPAASA